MTSSSLKSHDYIYVFLHGQWSIETTIIAVAGLEVTESKSSPRWSTLQIVVAGQMAPDGDQHDDENVAHCSKVALRRKRIWAPNSFY